MRSRLRSHLGVTLALLCGGCATGSIPAEKLPDVPIAFLYRTPEQGRRRAELLAEDEVGVPRRSGMMRLEDLETYLGRDRRPDEEFAKTAGRLALFDPRTSRVRTLDAVPRGAVPLAWSWEGERLLVASARHGPFQLLEIDFRSDGVRVLTRGPAIHPSGCYGPGGFLAYTEASRTRAGFEIRIVAREARAGAPRPLTPGPLDHSPTCSPDGRTIIYVSGSRGGREQLMAVPSKGGEPRRLGYGRNPAFAPDGEWVVYSAHLGGRWQLRRMRPDGSGKTAVGRGVGEESWPSVSPDGRHVVYEAEERGRKSLFVRRFDGSAQRILLAKGDGAHPVWFPNAEWRWK